MNAEQKRGLIALFMIAATWGALDAINESRPEVKERRTRELAHKLYGVQETARDRQISATRRQVMEDLKRAGWNEPVKW